jgi:hypothetical protein
MYHARRALMRHRCSDVGCGPEAVPFRATACRISVFRISFSFLGPHPSGALHHFPPCITERYSDTSPFAADPGWARGERLEDARYPLPSPVLLLPSMTHTPSRKGRLIEQSSPCFGCPLTPAFAQAFVCVFSLDCRCIQAVSFFSSVVRRARRAGIDYSSTCQAMPLTIRAARQVRRRAEGIFHALCALVGIPFPFVQVARLCFLNFEVLIFDTCHRY